MNFKIISENTALSDDGYFANLVKKDEFNDRYVSIFYIKDFYASQSLPSIFTFNQRDFIPASSLAEAIELASLTYKAHLKEFMQSALKALKPPAKKPTLYNFKNHPCICGSKYVNVTETEYKKSYCMRSDAYESTENMWINFIQKYQEIYDRNQKLKEE
jgi:hypothetical protein